MGLYIKDEAVRVRLIGKVRFTDCEDDENRFPNKLLRVLVQEAESDVEHELSPRYAAPFQTDDGQPFSKLPQRPTQDMIRIACELKAVVKVLETDFGRGTIVNGDEYAKKQVDRYEQHIERMLKKRKDSFNQWYYPPLPGLRLNYMNTAGDDGFAGAVRVTTDGIGDFPIKQINSPGENFWNGKIMLNEDDEESRE